MLKITMEHQQVDETPSEPKHHKHHRPKLDDINEEKKSQRSI